MNINFLSIRMRNPGTRFFENITVCNSRGTNTPIVAGNFFACAMGMDVSLKGIGRQKFDEVAVCEVKDGKTISEQFFF